ncbi:Pentatricopeptide repeat [Arabidopsis thaliana x Arabidopsis arenosa]|uniref:Pentatricopeptide repeat n=1 Tax=Arabidopsis thaliana x Arabidopsis arenosa TaxID=1240361 RepID=A0A8T1YDE7_9BRAS|nr:Pentatricopeptide repeat [Arabidopsis thaliana x Arabidopsis arenosa]
MSLFLSRSSSVKRFSLLLLSNGFSSTPLQTPPCTIMGAELCGGHMGRLIISNANDDDFPKLDKKVPMELVYNFLYNQRMVTIGASHGWVATLTKDDGILRLQDDLNPVASDLNPKRIPLPPLVTLPHCQTKIITNVSMSSSSPEDEDCVVAVKFLGPQLSFCRPAQRNSQWTNVRIENPCFFSSRVMFSKGMFHIPGSGGHLIGSWDLNHHTPKFQELHFQNLPELTKIKRELLRSCYRSQHLVESPAGETFLVKQYRKTDAETINGIAKLKTEALMVFKVNEYGTAVYTQDIGDLCIFLSNSEPFAVSATSFPGLYSNYVVIRDFDEIVYSRLTGYPLIWRRMFRFCVAWRVLKDPPCETAGLRWLFIVLLPLLPVDGGGPRWMLCLSVLASRISCGGASLGLLICPDCLPPVGLGCFFVAGLALRTASSSTPEASVLSVLGWCSPSSSVASDASASPFWPPSLRPHIYTCIPFFTIPEARQRNLIFTVSASSSSSSSSTQTKKVWRKQPEKNTTSSFQALRKHRRYQRSAFLDHNVDMDELLASIHQTQNEKELFSLLSTYKDRQLSIRFMVSLLSRENDWQRSLALLDWVHEEAKYTPSVFAYNVVLRNVLRAKQFDIAHGLFDEMRQRALAPDRFTYSTLITSFGKEGMFDSALSWLQKMEQDRVSGDLVLYSNLIELSRRLCDYSKAISIFSRLKRSGITPDLVAYNSMINVYGKAKLFKEARLLIKEMNEAGVSPNTVSYSTLLSDYVENQKFLEALSVFAEMKEVNCLLDLTTCNIMIDVYGQLDMVKEADRLFWSLRKMDIEPNVVSYNTILRVYGEAELFGEAIHLFRLMQRKDIEQNVVTYNTMIKIYGKTMEHEKATNLVQEMQSRGIEPNAITYSTIISIWGKAGKLDRAATLFQKLRSSGVEIDQVLYQTMIVAYERVGLMGHAKRLLHELKLPDNIPRETAITILAKAGRTEEATWVFRQAFESGEVKDISVFGCMINLYSRNQRYVNVIEVFEKMRTAGYFPDSNAIAMVLNAYGKQREFEKADTVYREMQEEGCVFPDEVHFQMLSLYSSKKDFEMVESLFERLESDPNVNSKELHLVVAALYERADKLNDASRVMNRMRERGILKPFSG